MKVIFVDIEHNKSRRLIQIGAHLFNLKTGDVLDSFDSLANPEEEIDPFIENLCGITTEMVATAPTRYVALLNFWAWVENCKCGNRVAAWGTDVEYLRRQSREVGIQDLPHVKDLNFKEFFGWVRDAKGGKVRGGLKSALDFAGIRFQGRPHNAADDARMTGVLGVYVFDMLRKFFLIQDVFK